MKTILEDEIKFYNLQAEENEEGEVKKVRLDNILDHLHSGDEGTALKPKLIAAL